jgi:DNA-binding IclR family transcriptional regulator
VAQQEGTLAVRHVIRVGDEMPLWAGAAAHVLLIDADEDTFATVAERSPYGAQFVDTLMERARLAAQRGWAFSHGEREVGASGVAAPIVDGAERVIAALALGGPTSRFTPERVADFGPALREAAAVLGQMNLGWPKF